MSFCGFFCREFGGAFIAALLNRDRADLETRTCADFFAELQDPGYPNWKLLLAFARSPPLLTHGGVSAVEILGTLLTAPYPPLCIAAACALASLCWAPRWGGGNRGDLQLDPAEASALARQLPHASKAFASPEFGAALASTDLTWLPAGALAVAVLMVQPRDQLQGAAAALRPAAIHVALWADRALMDYQPAAPGAALGHKAIQVLHSMLHGTRRTSQWAAQPALLHAVTSVCGTLRGEMTSTSSQRVSQGMESCLSALEAAARISSLQQALPAQAASLLLLAGTSLLAARAKAPADTIPKLSAVVATILQLAAMQTPVAQLTPCASQLAAILSALVALRDEEALLQQMDDVRIVCLLLEAMRRNGGPSIGVAMAPWASAFAKALRVACLAESHLRAQGSCNEQPENDFPTTLLSEAAAVIVCGLGRPEHADQDEALQCCTAAVHAAAALVAGQIAGALGGGGGRHGEVSAAAEHLAVADSLCALAAYLSGPAAAAFVPDGDRPYQDNAAVGEGHWYSVRQALVAAAAETVKAGRGVTAAATGGPSQQLLSGGIAAAVSLVAASGRRMRYLCDTGPPEGALPQAAEHRREDAEVAALLTTAISLVKFACHHLQKLVLSHPDRLSTAVRDAGAAPVLVAQLLWLGRGAALEKYLAQDSALRERFMSAYTQICKTLALLACADGPTHRHLSDSIAWRSACTDILQQPLAEGCSVERLQQGLDDVSEALAKPPHSLPLPPVCKPRVPDQKATRRFSQHKYMVPPRNASRRASASHSRRASIADPCNAPVADAGLAFLMQQARGASDVESSVLRQLWQQQAAVPHTAGSIASSSNNRHAGHLSEAKSSLSISLHRVASAGYNVPSPLHPHHSSSNHGGCGRQIPSAVAAVADLWALTTQIAAHRQGGPAVGPNPLACNSLSTPPVQRYSSPSAEGRKPHHLHGSSSSRSLDFQTSSHTAGMARGPLMSSFGRTHLAQPAANAYMTPGGPTQQQHGTNPFGIPSLQSLIPGTSPTQISQTQHHTNRHLVDEGEAAEADLTAHLTQAHLASNVAMQWRHSDRETAAEGVTDERQLIWQTGGAPLMHMDLWSQSQPFGQSQRMGELSQPSFSAQQGYSGHYLAAVTPHHNSAPSSEGRQCDDGADRSPQLHVLMDSMFLAHPTATAAPLSAVTLGRRTTSLLPFEVSSSGKDSMPACTADLPMDGGVFRPPGPSSFPGSYPRGTQGLAFSATPGSMEAAAATQAAPNLTSVVAEPAFPIDYAALLCPISLKPMRDPVICRDGYTYERRYIEDWLSKHDTSPRTNRILFSKDLSPNVNVRWMVAKVFPLD